MACLPRAKLVSQAAHLVRAVELLPEHLHLPLLVRGRGLHQQQVLRVRGVEIRVRRLRRLRVRCELRRLESELCRQAVRRALGHTLLVEAW